MNKNQAAFTIVTLALALILPRFMRAEVSGIETAMAARGIGVRPTARVSTQQNEPSVRGDAGALVGRVVLSDGSPAGNVQVLVELGPVRDGGITTWTHVARTRTDNNGQYRVEAPSGTYTIAAGAWLFRPTYYPGVIDEDGIRPVSVAAGQEVRGLDFSVDRRSGVLVRGRMVPSRGQDVTKLRVGIGDYIDHNQRLPLFGAPSFIYTELGFASVQPDGSFQFPAVPSGTYVLRVLPEDSLQNGSAYEVRLVVEGSDVNLEFPAPVFVKGRLDFGAGGLAPIARGLTGSFVPVRVLADGQESYSVNVSPDGSFFLAVKNGQYRVSLILPFGYYAKTFSSGTTDLLRAPLDLSGASPSEILGTVLTTPDSAKGYITLRGHVNLNNFSGAFSPLVAVLQGEGSDQMGYVVLGDSRVCGECRFEIHGIPPGTYRGYATHADNVPLPGERYDVGTTIVVGGKDLNDVELPLTLSKPTVR